MRAAAEIAEIEALAALASIPGLGSQRIRLALERFGSAEEALKARPQEWLGLPGFGERQLASLASAPAPQGALETAAKYGITLLSYRDRDYPSLLFDLPDYPLLLWVKGTLTQEDASGIAIIGTRNASFYGQEMAQKFGRELAARNRTVFSGLARGIDTHAHRGALETGRTVAVIGSGLERLYPAENRALAEKIAAQGALISELSPFTPPARQNFPRRNRLVSALSPLGVLLIEAPVKSGAMITMELAKQQKRPLFVLPGRADLESFKGNHWLLKRGEARLVEEVHDIEEGALLLEKATALPELQEEEKKVIKLLGPEERSLEELVQTTGLPMPKLSVLLMNLILKRRIKELPGKLYKIC